MRRPLSALAAVVAVSLFVPITAVHGASADNAGNGDRMWIVGLRRGHSVQNLADALSADARIVSESDDYVVIDASESDASRIAQRDEVAYVEPNRVFHTDGTQVTGPSGFSPPNDNVPWGLDVIDSRAGTQDDSYTWGNDGTGVTVYILDTGVQTTHPEFVRTLPGWGYRANDTAIRLYNALISTPDPSSPGHYLVDPCTYVPDKHQFDPATWDKTLVTSDDGSVDNAGHGTHVAGIVGGALTGVSKGVTIIPVRALDSCGNGGTTMITEALKWIVNHHATDRAVVNMSLGLDRSSTSIDTQIAALIAEGVSVVAASGNSGTTSCNTSPAGTKGTISVASVGASMQESRFSNYGQCVDIFAPGGEITANSSLTAGQGILSAWPKYGGVMNTYLEEVGTSMATPFVTGAVAQYLQGVAWSTTNPADAWAAIRRNATCGLVTYQRTGVVQTPNRVVNVGVPAVPCAPAGVTATQVQGTSTITWEELPSGNGADITGYQVTTEPASTGCTTDAATLTCTLNGLASGTNYTVSVRAVNSVGPGAAKTVTVSTPDVAVAPATASASSTSNSIVVGWSAITATNPVTYTVAVSPGKTSCSTTTTTCTFLGVKLGTAYTFQIVATIADGSASIPLVVKITAGFNQKVTSVAPKSRTLLRTLVSTISKGARTYKVSSGKCKIVSGRLVAPSAPGGCRVKVMLAKKGKYRAMSAVLPITVA